VLEDTVLKFSIQESSSEDSSQYIRQLLRLKNDEAAAQLVQIPPEKYNAKISTYIMEQ